MPAALARVVRFGKKTRSASAVVTDTPRGTVRGQRFAVDRPEDLPCQIGRADDAPLGVVVEAVAEPALALALFLDRLLAEGGDLKEPGLLGRGTAHGLSFAEA